MGLRVCGIDWATQEKNRAAVVLEQDDTASNVLVQEIIWPLTDERALSLCTTSEFKVTAVDTPFGWSRSFTEFVAAWRPTVEFDPQLPKFDEFRFRLTDRIVRKEVGKHPLSVSSDRIALAARTWTELADRGKLAGRIDVGRGQTHTVPPVVIEVYPGATLAILLPRGGDTSTDSYKREPFIRAGVVDALVRQFSLTCSDRQRAELVSSGEDSDKTDALIAALTALCYLERIGGWTVRRPTADQMEEAEQEGWIFFPVRNERSPR